MLKNRGNMLFFLIICTFIGTTILGMEESAPINMENLSLTILMSGMTKGLILKPECYEKIHVKDIKPIAPPAYKEFVDLMHSHKKLCNLLMMNFQESPHKIL